MRVWFICSCLSCLLACYGVFTHSQVLSHLRLRAGSERGLFLLQSRCFGTPSSLWCVLNWFCCSSLFFFVCVWVSCSAYQFIAFARFQLPYERVNACMPFCCFDGGVHLLETPHTSNIYAFIFISWKLIALVSSTQCMLTNNLVVCYRNP